MLVTPVPTTPLTTTHEPIVLRLTHQRVDDVPLLLGFLIKLRFPQLLDQFLVPHPLHQGLSQGWLITIWITYILSQADHRKASVRDWVRGLHHTLEACTGQTIRDVDFTDDRLTLVLAHLSDTNLWDRIETELWGITCEVYELPVEQVRLDTTTSCGFHTIVAGGFMPLGHSKDHRSDLPQLKLMAAVAEPTGQLLASTVHPGNDADDPLYLPMIARVRALLGRKGLLYTGDCKMAALETRADIAAQGDFYLTILPMTPAAKDEFLGWVEDAVSGKRRGDLVPIRIGEKQVGTGYEITRELTATVAGSERTWTERVQVIRSDSLADTQARALQRRLEQAEAAIRGLTPPRGPGKVQFTVGWELERAVAAVLAEFGVTDLLEVAWEREESRETRYVGRGRGGPNRPKKTITTCRYQITSVRRNTRVIEERLARMGWRAQVTNVPAKRLSLSDSVAAYRGGSCVERDFHVLKSRPLGIRPLYVHRDDQLVGLTHLLTLGLRVLTLFELLVRRGQEAAGESLKGLYAGQASRTTARPTGTRVLGAIARLGITLTRVEEGEEDRWHLTPLPELLRRVLGYVGLPETVYTRLVMNSS
jgi:transposase